MLRLMMQVHLPTVTLAADLPSVSPIYEVGLLILCWLPALVLWSCCGKHHLGSSSTKKISSDASSVTESPLVDETPTTAELCVPEADSAKCALDALPVEEQFRLCVELITKGGEDGKGTCAPNSFEVRRALYIAYKQAKDGDVRGRRPSLTASLAYPSTWRVARSCWFCWGRPTW